MSKIDLAIIGGFLGAGKTTSIVSIAKYLLENNKRVGIVTNDQGSDLVDSSFLRSVGLSVLEVKEGCFCCNFDQFLEKIYSFTEQQTPDIVLAEPVGSCTDLIATVFKPLERDYLDKINLKPLSIVVDPKRLKKLMIEKNSSFHSEINYLFQKQLEEADIIVLNKIDTLILEEVKEMNNFLRKHFYDTEIINVSAKSGTNIERWVEKIFNLSPSEKVLEIDYDLYGKAEGRLGWLNATFKITGENIDINSIIKNLLEEARSAFLKNHYEIAHLKAYGISLDDWAKASIVSTEEPVTFDKSSEISANVWNIVINARADIEANNLKDIILDVLDLISEKYKIKIYSLNIQSFKPKKPTPRYRITE
ncbi:MAG: hypothetical protein N2380_09525 [bacterium]|nr:hypothetical protein [bacterium]